MEKEYFNSKFENLTDYNTLSVQEKQKSAMGLSMRCKLKHGLATGMLV